MKTVLLVVLVALGTVSGRKIVDLTHTLDKDAPAYSVKSFGVKNMTYYKRTKVMEKYVNSDTWISIGVVEFYEHMGTHIDAPFHFGNGRQKLHEIPVHRLVGPGVVIDVRDKVKNNLDYAVSVEDIQEYEEKFGRIASGSIVMMNSDWDKRYPSRVFGTDDIDNMASYHYPGYSIEACKMLYEERQISVLGTDSVSVDPQQLELDCHKYLQPLNVPLMEYIANLDSIPQNGTTIILGAPKIRDGTGGLTRVLAFVHEDGDDDMNNLANHVPGFSCALVLFVALCHHLRTYFV